jgi:UDP-N-acetylmuramoylalanine--D-glutamate ligase
MYNNKKILILGAAKSGISVAKILAKDNNVTLTDIKEIDEVNKLELEKLGVKIIITNDQINLIDKSWDLIVKNPAIMHTSEINQKCLKLGLRIENEMEVGYHFLPKNVFIIGITGSNGKTTTTTIIFNLLKLMGKSVVLGGNIGEPLCAVLPRVKENDILLLEISDHQLLNFHDFKTNISVLTNICPTHLDYHGSYEHYKYTKKNIFLNHTNKELAIINGNNEDALEVSKDILSRKEYFNGKDAYLKDNGLYVKDKLIIKTDEIRLVGNHNYENILAALLVINEFGIDEKIVKEFLSSFNGVEHRIEFVKEIDGVKYYNDSKATNPTSTITALKTFNKPVHLILGGLERYQDFNELNGYLDNVKCIYAIGEVTDRIETYANENNIECKKCYKLKEALSNIFMNVKFGDIVLLSPASASQDQYKRFEDRGDEFKEIVNACKSK